MQNKTHLGVYGIITKDDLVLLIKKSRGPYTGKLDLPGGRLEHGENIKEALAREVNEETGLKVSKISLIDNYTTTVKYENERGVISMHHIGLIYQVEDFDTAEPIKEMDKEDSLGAEWYKIADLHADQLSPFAQEVIKNIS